MMLLRILLESFKLHYVFSASNTCYEYFAVLHKSGQMPEAAKQSLTWMPEFRSMLYSEQCAYIALEHLANALSKFKCLAAKHDVFEPT